MIPDSAIGRDSQPWFLPDFGSNWRGYEAVGLRISRLGKGIMPKFAERYVDAVTTMWVAEADDCMALDFMDGRVVTGKWKPYETSSCYDSLFKLLVDASKYATLKNGDIIAVVKPESAHDIYVGQHIENTDLSFNIK